MLIVFMGPPGSGKGTQSGLLREKLELAGLSTGDMLREAKNSGSDFGEMIQFKLDTGQLIEDEHVLKMVIDSLESLDATGGALLDGFPRTIAQAEALDVYLSSQNRQLDVVIQLIVPIEQLIERLNGRYAEMANPRPEDHPDFVRRRLDIYETITKPLADFYSARGVLRQIDGLGSVNDVFVRIDNAIASLR